MLASGLVAPRWCRVNRGFKRTVKIHPTRRGDVVRLNAASLAPDLVRGLTQAGRLLPRLVFVHFSHFQRPMCSCLKTSVHTCMELDYE